VRALGNDVLIYGVTWLGDAIMSMPAIEAARARSPKARFTLLARPDLAPLWRLQPALAAVDVLESGGGTWQAGRRLRGRGFSCCFILPNSFRSAWIPFLAGIPVRRGFRGHWRSLLLTEIAVPAGGSAPLHQAAEYFSVFGLEAGRVAPPRLDIPDSLHDAARTMLGERGPGRWMVLLPGAARGPAKRWPPERFAEIGRRVRDSTGLGMAVLGSEQEQTICAEVADGIGNGAVSLAGQTSLPLLAAVLAAGRIVLANDSGGMHLATAVGTPVVAVFGLTDPRTTGPLGETCRVVTAAGAVASRAIPRDSARARAALDAVGVDDVLEAVHSLLEATREPA